MYTKGKILVTGGAGFVGSHVVLELIKSGYPVVVLDNFANCQILPENQKPSSIKIVESMTDETVIFYNVDITERLQLINVFQEHDIEVVIHLAALRYIGESKALPVDYYHTNITGSCTLFQVMTEFKVKHLIFSSTSNVYGTPDYLPINESHPTGLQCRSPYERSKYLVEEILKDVCHSDEEWKVIALRYFTPSGAHEWGLLGEDTIKSPNSLFAHIAEVAMGARGELCIPCSKDQEQSGFIRDYTHVMDLATGHKNALMKLDDLRGWAAYNLGTGRAYSCVEVIDTFAKLSGKPIKYRLKPAPGVSSIEVIADTSLAQQELKWTAFKGIEDICRDTWNWYCNKHNTLK
ncbi:hypothetical protein PPYR_01898 [Photinus pyralis]|uniref:UDP-N-acetylglucosamine 4-epimerase n=1 Tax=Photinus pyralis TaxID=7054 RepID=A0A5N4AXN9_PHOPY|nr:UDP-glucose 4-epimerase-like [Photinus pyralis]XP_031335336.1 UDP-glucose 4-epimerase-like [Photinus pyralis]KAB0802086.1 hypothetical protein PPYR_04272 [Photinus pyralis]KAB0804928.1 hypothetical protein PPYR_01898 [Photinus pyralis]